MSKTTRRTNPNINAVAREAGVSVGTVSNALNNPARLADETLQRVPAERVAVLRLSKDLTAGALRGLRAYPSMRVPQDVAVLGLDSDHRDNGVDWIALTSIVLPGQAMGAEAVRLLESETQPRHVHE